MIQQNNNTQYYDKHTCFMLLDTTNKNITFDYDLKYNKHLVYLNRNVRDGETEFEFVTLNNTIKITRDVKNDRHIVKFYNCNHIQPPSLSGVGWDTLDTDEQLREGFHFNFYYPTLTTAIFDSIKTMMELEKNITIYGTLYSENCSEEFLHEIRENIIRDVGLKKLYSSNIQDWGYR